MAQKKPRGNGRATPKGTVDPSRSGRPERRDVPSPPTPPPHELRGKAGKQSHKAARPITHHRGNR